LVIVQGVAGCVLDQKRRNNGVECITAQEFIQQVRRNAINKRRSFYSAPKAIADFHPHFFYHSAFFQGHANWAMRNHIDNSNKNPPIANQRLFLECIPHLVSAN
jgi:hypothetical protein